MKVRDYLKQHGIEPPKPGECPRIKYLSSNIRLYKMAMECCESSFDGSCVEHFMDAEMGYGSK